MLPGNEPIKTREGDDDFAVLQEIRERAAHAIEAWQHNFDAAVEDVAFLAGAQWPEPVRKEREDEGRPCLTLNKLPQYVDQVLGDQRQNRPAISVHPVEANAASDAAKMPNVAGNQDYDLAQIYEALIRNIEYTSNAEAHYDTAFQHAVEGGFGWLRVIPKYSSDDAFEQDLCIKSIHNRFAVLMDPQAIEPDYSDANWCFIGDKMKRAEFRKRYPNAAVGDLTDADRAEYSWWTTEEMVRVAEYFYREPATRELLLLSDGRTVWQDQVKQVLDELAEMGITVIRRRQVKTYRVKWMKVTAYSILEGPVDWPGSTIPVAPVLGKEITIGDRTHYRGLIRFAKDAQRMHNYWMPLCLETPIPTPEGWSTMGSIQLGDQVFDEQGRRCNVVGKSPVHINRECFRVEFDDGSHIIADKQHPWMVEERGSKVSAGYDWQPRKLTTGELEPKRHFIWSSKPIEGEEADLPVDPYLLGYWLGDGRAESMSFTVDHEDVDEVRKRFRERGLALGDIHQASRKGDAATFSVKGMMPALRGLGIVGNKHVPAEYLRASRQQRLDLLRGLMDTDGSISSRFQCAFHNTNDAIIEGFIELLRSFGIKSSTCRREGRVSMLANGQEIMSSGIHQVSFTPQEDLLFCMKRKADMQRRKPKGHDRRTKRFGIRAVTPVESVPVQCIAVDSKSHLFLAGPSMIPTHNTAATERVALAPKAPYTGPVEAFEGFENIWAQANRQNRGYLPYNAVPSGDRPRREQPATMPAAELQLALGATDELKSTIGLYDASVGNEGNETSGKAILARQRQGDRGTFAYIDNLSRAIRRVGQILIEMIPRIYDSERVLRLRFEDGEGDWVSINQTVMDEETGKEILVHDIAAGKFDVTVKAGPSYQTQRIEAAESLMQFVQAIPAAGQVVLDLIAKNMDWPGSQEIAKRLKKALPPGVLEPDEMEEAGIEPPQPSPEQQATMAKSQADQAQAEADMAGAEADKAKAEADTMKAQADMAEARRQMAEIEMQAAMAGPGTMEETVRNLVAEAMAELMAEGQVPANA